MREIALHILDVAENGIQAGASHIQITVDENRRRNRLTVEICDNGRGMPPEMVSKVTDPFVSTRTTRRVGLGLSLMEAAARRCAGEFSVASTEGRGTRVKASFQYDHIDRAPLGDLAGTVMTLVAGNAAVEFTYVHKVNEAVFTFDTVDIRRELAGIDISSPGVFGQLAALIKKNLDRLSSSD